MRVASLAFILTPGLALAEPPRVVADIAPVHSIAAAVMEGVATPSLIVPPTASPHGYSLRPSEARALDRADMVVWVGPALAPWLDGPVDALAGEAKVLTLLDVPGTNLLDLREGAAFEAGHEGHDHRAHDHGDHEHDHAEHSGDKEDHDGHDHDAHDHDDHDHSGHDHASDAKAEHEHDHEDHAHDHDDHAHGDDHDKHAEGIDAHAWLDPQNAITWANEIATQLGELDPENAATYSDNALKFRQDISNAEADIAALLAPVQGKPFVVFHDAYHYFEDHFGVEAVGAVSAGDAASASAGRVAELRERIAEFGAVCALTEPQFNPGVIEAVGAVKLGEVDPIGAALTEGPDLYEAMLRNMASALAECLQ